VPGEPLPVIVDEYVPALADVKVHGVVVLTFAAKLTDGFGQLTVRPVGLSTCENATVPAKLFTLVKETETEVEAPVLKSARVTNAIVKSPT
jgi:hypothetical protein